jgi:isopenicillin N synthase-like dioxygenase
MQEIQNLAVSFSRLIAEALDMDSNCFDKFFDTPQHNKLKLVKYPAPSPDAEIPKGGVQGVGARKY